MELVAYLRDGNDDRIGAVLFDGVELQSTHPSVLEETLHGGVTADQPEAFIRGLYKHYKSAYFRAEEAKPVTAADVSKLVFE